MKFLSNKQPGLDMREALKIKGRLPVMCAISYIGANATEYLPLKRGDILVCDAEVFTVKQGSTVPESLEEFHRRGVKIFSRRGLHAKVIAASRTAWIGSANASESSSKKIEASIRVTDPTTVQEVREFITDLTRSPGYKLSLKMIHELIALERRKGFVQGTSVEPERLPETIRRLIMVRFHIEKTYAKEIKFVEKSKKQAIKEKSKMGTKTSLEDFIVYGTTKMRLGDWVVLFNGEEIDSPAQVVSIYGDQNPSVYWLARPQISSDHFLQEDLERRIKVDFPKRAHEFVLDTFDANKALKFFGE